MLDCWQLNVFKGKFQVFSEKTKKRTPKFPTKARIKNIALYYLERFETSEDNLRNVLKRRIDKYAFFDKSYNKQDGYTLVEEVVKECIKNNFVCDERFAEFKINSYLRAGKSKRYIEQKLKLKGISENIVEKIIIESEYNEFDVAYNFAKKKKIGPFRGSEEARTQYYQKDLSALVRAGFSFDVAKDILDSTE
ncbi:MAG: regulatory protein RecX [Alphaproteobacteria bacterium]|nr:regulatory protein RecX [Alphaproteobacteria bacterium]